MPSDAPGDQARAGRGRRRRDRRSSAPPARSAGRSPSALAAERGLSIIPPYDDDRIIAGQGTVGLELVEDLPDLAAVLVPIGGGGLASGVATAVRALRPDARVIGVEPELAADARDSLAAGEIVELAGRARLADDRRRHADPGARAADVRPPARLPRLDRDRDRGRDRRRRPPRGRAKPARRRAVRARWRSRRCAFRPARPAWTARWAGRRGGQRRQRRPGALPRATWRRAGPARGLTRRDV